MTTAVYSLDPTNSSNPDCMTLHVSDDEAVAQLAAVLPALAECGGYDGGLVDPDCRSDLLDYQGGRQCDNVWGGRVWASQDSDQWIDVTIKVCRDDDYNKVVITRTHSRVLRGQDVVETRPYTGKSWRNPRPNVRRETAKAVANFLAVTCTPEAAAQRAADELARAASAAEYCAKQAAVVAHQTERMVAMAKLAGSIKTEQELRGLLADELAKVVDSALDMKALAGRIGDAVSRRWETLDAAQSDAWDAIDYELGRNA